MHSDSESAVTYHWLWKETSNRLASLSREAKEGKNLAEASNFARWVRFSGIIKLLEQHPQAGELRVDAESLSKSIDDLLWECGQQWNRRKPLAKYDVSDIAEINRKLDILAAQAAKLDAISAQVAHFKPPIKRRRPRRVVIAPELRVIQGGDFTPGEDLQGVDQDIPPGPTPADSAAPILARGQI